MCDALAERGFNRRTGFDTVGKKLAPFLRKVYRLPETHQPVLRIPTGKEIRRHGQLTQEEIVRLDVPN